MKSKYVIYAASVLLSPGTNSTTAIPVPRAGVVTSVSWCVRNACIAGSTGTFEVDCWLSHNNAATGQADEFSRVEQSQYHAAALTDTATTGINHVQPCYEKVRAGETLYLHVTNVAFQVLARVWLIVETN